jgi:hypothetical protein
MKPQLVHYIQIACMFIAAGLVGVASQFPDQTAVIHTFAGLLSGITTSLGLVSGSMLTSNKQV